MRAHGHHAHGRTHAAAEAARKPAGWMRMNRIIEIGYPEIEYRIKNSISRGDSISGARSLAAHCLAPGTDTCSDSLHRRGC
jgi:hypothetical protein